MNAMFRKCAVIIDEAHMTTSLLDATPGAVGVCLAVSGSYTQDLRNKCDMVSTVAHRDVLAAGAIVPVKITLSIDSSPFDNTESALCEEACRIVDVTLAYNKRALVLAPNMTIPDIQNIAKHIKQILINMNIEDYVVHVVHSKEKSKLNRCIIESFKADSSNQVHILLSVKMLIEGYNDKSLGLCIFAGECSDYTRLYQGSTRVDRAYPGKSEGQVVILHPDMEALCDMMINYDPYDEIFRFECDHTNLNSFIRLDPEARKQRKEETILARKTIKAKAERTHIRKIVANDKQIRSEAVRFLFTHHREEKPTNEFITITHGKQTMSINVDSFVNELCKRYDDPKFTHPALQSMMRSITWIPMNRPSLLPIGEASSDITLKCITNKTTKVFPTSSDQADQLCLDVFQTDFVDSPPHGGIYYWSDEKVAVPLRMWIMCAHFARKFRDDYPDAPDIKLTPEYLKRMNVPTNAESPSLECPRTRWPTDTEINWEIYSNIVRKHSKVLKHSELINLLYDYTKCFTSPSTTDNTMRKVAKLQLGWGVGFYHTNAPYIYEWESFPQITMATDIKGDLYSTCKSAYNKSRSDIADTYILSKLLYPQIYMMKLLERWSRSHTDCQLKLKSVVFAHIISKTPTLYASSLNATANKFNSSKHDSMTDGNAVDTHIQTYKCASEKKRKRE